MRPCRRLSVRGMPVSFQTFHQKRGRDPVGEEEEEEEEEEVLLGWVFRFVCSRCTIFTVDT